MIVKNIKSWFGSGTPWIWLNAGAVSVSILLVLGLLTLIAIRGLGHFWPKSIAEFDYMEADGTTIRIIGELVDHESVPRTRVTETDTRIPADATFIERYLIKTGNRDYFGIDFRWVLGTGMSDIRYPREVMAVERREWGNLYAYLIAVNKDGQVLVSDPALIWDSLQQIIGETTVVNELIEDIAKDQIGDINYSLERLRLQEKRLAMTQAESGPELAFIQEQQAELQQQYDAHTEELANLYSQLGQYSITTKISDGTEIELPLAQVVRAYQPNSMSLLARTGFYLEKLYEFVSEDPREANTEGGIFPAIFGTVMMVIIMSIMVTPFGVIAAVYLREYARQGPLVRIVRIAVYNLAGVPSVVYGVFGLGFFVYFVGGNIDQLFFAETLPSPTFGTPGLMWASLTLAILTVPVVVVSTEEGLSRVPRSIREGSLALGATKAETLMRTVLPMTASAMMTGLILAIARAAGEVAPLMLVGVVKLAPSLPLDDNFPFLHLERKFMHLGFHIYDVGFQSPNVEAARPLVYATALLLVLIIIFLNLAAIHIRNKLREKYRASEQH
jgi:phosphate transport system permease protein